MSRVGIFMPMGDVLELYQQILAGNLSREIGRIFLRTLWEILSVDRRHLGPRVGVVFGTVSRCPASTSWRLIKTAAASLTAWFSPGLSFAAARFNWLALGRMDGPPPLSVCQHASVLRVSGCPASGRRIDDRLLCSELSNGRTCAPTLAFALLPFDYPSPFCSGWAWAEGSLIVFEPRQSPSRVRPRSRESRQQSDDERPEDGFLTEEHIVQDIRRICDLGRDVLRCYLRKLKIWELDFKIHPAAW